VREVVEVVEVEENCMGTFRSCESGSLFFIRNPFDS